MILMEMKKKLHHVNIQVNEKDKYNKDQVEKLNQSRKKVQQDMFIDDDQNVKLNKSKKKYNKICLLMIMIKIPILSTLIVWRTIQEIHY